MRFFIFTVAGPESVSSEIMADSFLPGVKRTGLVPHGEVNDVVIFVHPRLQGSGERIGLPGNIREVGSVVLTQLPDIPDGVRRGNATG